MNCRPGGAASTCAALADGGLSARTVELSCVGPVTRTDLVVQRLTSRAWTLSDALVSTRDR
jgi:hypothetical protein